MGHSDQKSGRSHSIDSYEILKLLPPYSFELVVYWAWINISCDKSVACHFWRLVDIHHPNGYSEWLVRYSRFDISNDWRIWYFLFYLLLEVTTYIPLFWMTVVSCNILGRFSIGWRMGIGQNVLNMSQTDWSFHGASKVYSFFLDFWSVWTLIKENCGWTMKRKSEKKQTTGRQELVENKTHQPQNPTTTIGVANPIAIPLTKDNWGSW